MDNVQRAKTGTQLPKGASKDDLDIRNRNLVTDAEVWGQSRWLPGRHGAKFGKNQGMTRSLLGLQLPVRALGLL